MLTPVQFGGKTVYLVISGTSMQPTFYEGDLVVLRQTETYKIGDAAAYYEPSSGGIIIHRIIDQVEDRFILLGDNKERPDLYRPALADMLGRYWFHIPKLGQVAGKIGGNKHESTIQSLMTILGAILFLPKQISRKKGQRLKPKSKKTYRAPMNGANLGKVNKVDLAFFLSALTAASLFLSFLAFRTPLYHTVNDDHTYTQQGTFSYLAEAPPGIYNADIVQTGEPIFRQLINKVTINFDYQFISDLPGALEGSYQMFVEISHANGWHLTFDLTPETHFTGDSFNTNTIIDLSQVQLIIDNLEQQTGLNGQSYRLSFMSNISLEGQVDGLAIQDQFSPRLNFDLDSIQMQLAKPEASNKDSSLSDLLNPSQTGKLKLNRERQVSNKFSIFGFEIAVSLARQLAVSGSLISVCGLFVLGIVMFRAKSAGEVAWIAFNYGARLLPVQTYDFAKEEKLIEMTTIDNLVHLAQQEGCMIMYLINEEGHHYFVNDGRATYRYFVNRTMNDER
jgi:signal peptidase I